MFLDSPNISKSTSLSDTPTSNVSDLKPSRRTQVMRREYMATNFDTLEVWSLYQRRKIVNVFSILRELHTSGEVGPPS